MSTFELQTLIEKTSHWDKDERYMATNDICSFLNKNTNRIEEHWEQKICNAVLKQLDDQSNDVRSVAVKCLAILVKKAQPLQIGEICKKLSNLIVDSNKNALLDIYSIGLRTLIIDVPESMGSTVVEKLSLKLTAGIAMPNSEDIKRECLDNLSELLKRFGHLNEPEHVNIITVVVDQLKHEKTAIRKRAGQCLGSLAVVTSETLLNNLMKILLDRIQELVQHAGRKGIASQETRTLIQTIGTISRTVGYRLGKYLPQIIPLFIQFCGDPNDEDSQDDATNELRESCFPGLESFVLRCPKEVLSFIPDIIRVSIAFMKYDPNYSYDDEDQENEGDNDEEYDYDEDYGDEDYGGSEDDDSSWKVRKASIKVIAALIQSNINMSILHIYDLCGAELLTRFKEREENVRLDIVETYTMLLEKVFALTNASNSLHLVYDFTLLDPLTNSTASTASGSVGSAGSLGETLTSSMEIESTKDTLTTAANPLLITFYQQKIEIVYSMVMQQLNQFTSKSYQQRHHISPTTQLKSITALLKLLKVLFQSGLMYPTEQLIQLITAYAMNFLQIHMPMFLEDKNATLKILALQTLFYLFKLIVTYLSQLTAIQSNLQPALLQLFPLILQIIQHENHYRLTSEAFRVLSIYIQIITTFTSLHDTNQLQTMVNNILTLTLSKMETLDLDHEIKETSLICMATLLSQLGTLVDKNNYQKILMIYLKRLEIENLRLITLHAMLLLTTSSTLDLSLLLSESSMELYLNIVCNHLSTRQIKLATLSTLYALLHHPSCSVSVMILDRFLVVISSLWLNSTINHDFQFLHASLIFMTQLITKQPNAFPSLDSKSSSTSSEGVISQESFHKFYESLVHLIKFSPLQSIALEAYIQLIQTLIQLNMSYLPFISFFQYFYGSILFQTSSSTSSSATSSTTVTTKGMTSNIPTKQSMINVAKCLSGACATMVKYFQATSQEVLYNVLSLYLQDIESYFIASNTNKLTMNIHKVIFAFYCLGELGQTLSFTLIPGKEQAINDLFITCLLTNTLTSGSTSLTSFHANTREEEELKLSCAYAFGHSIISNSLTLLPLLIDCIGKVMKQPPSPSIYYLLIACKEAIDTYIHLHLPYEPSFLQGLLLLLQTTTNQFKLFEYSAKDEIEREDFSAVNASNPTSNVTEETNIVNFVDIESIRNVFAECLGSLSIWNIEAILPIFAELKAQGQRDGNPLIVRVVISSLRSALSHNIPPQSHLFTMFSSILYDYLLVLQEQHIELKKTCLVMINTILHHNPALIVSYIQSTIMPLFIQILQTKMERTVDLGPFKHKVDDYLPLRKTVLSCLETMLQTCKEQLDIDAVMSIAPILLTDTEEIKLLFLQFLPRITLQYPTAILNKLIEMTSPFETILDKNKKDHDTKGKDYIKATLRVIITINSLEESKGIHPKWSELLDKVNKDPIINIYYKPMEHDTF